MTGIISQYAPRGVIQKSAGMEPSAEIVEF